MKSFFFAIGTAIPLFLFATHSPSKMQEMEESTSLKESPIVKVLIAQNISGALVDVKGGYKVINPETKKVLSSGNHGKRYYLQTTSNGLKWGEGYIGIHQIEIVPKDKGSSILIDGMQYKGALSVYDINGQMQLVNHVDVESTLKSLLSYEFGTSEFKDATYDAIAIAARTHLYNVIFHRQNPYWDISAKDLKYEGSGAILVHPAIDRAVLATEYLIMTYEDKPFPTSWTENSGGRTASYVDVFRKKVESPNGVTAPYAQKMREDHKWKCILSNDSLSRLFHLNRITSIDLFQEPSAKKTYAIRINDGKHFVELTFGEFQQKIGADRILSNDLFVHILKENIVFEGYGKGYGVGLCLFSAEEMAKVGRKAPEILTYFYPNTHLVKLSHIPETFKDVVEEASLSKESP